MFKLILGCLLVIVGVLLGLYVGFWLCVAGGIISIVHGLQSDPISATAIAFGVVRILVAGFVGWISALVLILPGIAIAKSA